MGLADKPPDWVNLWWGSLFFRRFFLFVYGHLIFSIFDPDRTVLWLSKVLTHSLNLGQ